MALGHLRIHPFDWARWTMREFWLTYQGWLEINVYQPWEIGRAVSFYILNSQGAKLNKWEDVFSVGGSKEISEAIFRNSTPEEQAEFERMTKDLEDG